MLPEQVMLMKMEVQTFAKFLGRKRITKTAYIKQNPDGSTYRYSSNYHRVTLVYSAKKERWFNGSVKNDLGIDWGSEDICDALKEVHATLQYEVIEKIIRDHREAVLALVGIEVVNF